MTSGTCCRRFLTEMGGSPPTWLWCRPWRFHKGWAMKERFINSPVNVREGVAEESLTHSSQRKHTVKFEHPVSNSICAKKDKLEKGNNYCRS
ncbi:hypothetical protein RRG08_057778 [Elysia crispata]|uniref:Uncharacterized protein n=1 Tax=Elysia crispata TaxID=231223 RepID=A0AAE0ZNY8_9GAST|nr:hypothetical protein RRG08_057778 [Elysia crispata]